MVIVVDAWRAHSQTHVSKMRLKCKTNQQKNNTFFTLPLNDPRRFVAQKQPDPRVLFTLCHHAASSPSLYVLKPAKLEAILRAATENYIESNVTVAVSAAGR